MKNKLAEIQQALKAPKGQKNAHGGYMYRSCEDILEAVKPLLGETALTISDEIIAVGDRYYVKATATLHLGDDSISVSACAREQVDKLNKMGKPMMDQSQITGSTSSYARKYALNGLFAIDDTKDADSTETHGNDKPAAKTAAKKAAPKQRGKKLTDAQLETIIQACKESGYTKGQVKKACMAYSNNQAERIEDLTEEEAKTIITKLTEQ